MPRLDAQCTPLLRTLDTTTPLPGAATNGAEVSTAALSDADGANTADCVGCCVLICNTYFHESNQARACYAMGSLRHKHRQQGHNEAVGYPAVLLKNHRISFS